MVSLACQDPDYHYFGDFIWKDKQCVGQAKNHSLIADKGDNLDGFEDYGFIDMDFCKECKDYSDSLKPKKEEEVDRSESKVC